MKKLALVILLAMVGLAAARAKKPASLDGRSFKVVLTSPDASPAPATLKFAGGKLTVDGVSGPYSAKATRGVTFSAHLKAADKSLTDWTGTIDDTRIDGTATHTIGKTKAAFTFTGSEDKP